MLSPEECDALWNLTRPDCKTELSRKLGPDGSALADFCARFTLSEEDGDMLQTALERMSGHEYNYGSIEKAKIVEALRARLLGGE